VNGVLQSDEDEWFAYAADDGPFTILVRVTNSVSQAVWDNHVVSVSYSAPECLDM
jgi:hypothetical protein